jgi:putative ATP-dependent endonuclease of OLD family
MRKFHSALTEDKTRVSTLQEKFREIESIFNEVPEFSNFRNELTELFEQTLSGMSYGLQIDFSAYDPSRFFHSLQVVPHEGGQRRTIDELGTGQEQLLALAFAHAYAKSFYGGIVLAIDEPEAHLHPLAQGWLAKQIHQMCKDGLQVILTTHSPHFINILDLEGLILVYKDAQGATKVKQLDSSELAEHCRTAGAVKATAENFLPFYADHATEEVLNGFFAKKIVLVEGWTEKLALPVYLEAVGLDINGEGIAIVPVMGKGNLPKWWRLFTAYNIPTYVTFDNDDSDDDKQNKRTELLKTISIPDTRHKYILEHDDWLIEDIFSVFGKNFEECMRVLFSDYADLEKQAWQSVGSSKPLVARSVAEKLKAGGQGTNDAGWEKFRRLAEKLRHLGRDVPN